MAPLAKGLLQRLLLAAAWSLAVSERHEDADRCIARLLQQPGVDDALRCECALIGSGANLTSAGGTWILRSGL